MSSANLIKYILLFITLVGVQVLILNNIQLSGYINPYLYVLAILALPFGTPRWTVLLISFALGLIIDTFQNSTGLHTAATVFLGYSRHFILNIMKPRDGYESFKNPSIKDMGSGWFLTYSALLIFFHHFVFFFLEIFRFTELLQILGRIILSTLFTFVLVLLTQLLFGRTQTSNESI